AVLPLATLLPPVSTLFPYTTLFRSGGVVAEQQDEAIRIIGGVNRFGLAAIEFSAFFHYRLPMQAIVGCVSRLSLARAGPGSVPRAATVPTSHPAHWKRLAGPVPAGCSFH